MSEITGFEYVDLNQIDPSFKPVPQDLYQLQVLDAGLKEFSYKKNTVDKAGVVVHAVGDVDQYVSITLAITNNETYAGRRLFESLFFGPRELRTLRRLMDVTGVRQEPGVSLQDWLAQLAEIKPEFRCPVDQVPDKRAQPNADGTLPPKNVVRWKDIMPLGA